MEDFLKFKKMITPLIIQILFWIGTVVIVLMGLGQMVAGVARGPGILVLTGLLWVLLGPLVVRIYCELLIILFSINDTLRDIKNKMRDNLA